jgi:transposase
LSEIQERGLVALLREKTIADAAAMIGVSERTIYNWLNEPPFRKAYHEARSSIMDAAIARMQQISQAAIDALEKNLKTKNRNAVNAAAKAILEHAIRGVETRELMDRVAELEARLEAMSAPKPPEGAAEEEPDDD